MKTLEKLKNELKSIPLATSWYLSALDEFKGKQELYNKQSPQKLKHLKEHALIESSISSNRMEGVNVAQARIETVIFGSALLKDRDEEEIRGYQQALRWIHESHDRIDINLQTILKLHKLSRGDIWDAGQLKEKQIDITEILPNGKSRIRFKPPGIKESKIFLIKAIDLWNEQIKEKYIPPLILLIAFNFDFLCIHPFRDGNGRVSRLILLLQLYKLGYDIGSYISIERIIEENKDRYYETLEQSSNKWHEAKNDIWPYVNYILFILKESYKQLDTRLENLPNNRGNKSELIINFIGNSIGPFSIADIKYNLPGVSVELIRKLLKDLQNENKVRSLGRGRNAKWEKL
ncbi:Fic family protein [Leptospira ilyithenensis]|uniref:Fic family protein n=1 Tax=Leptospira ilyithenensis TaxID=2484901 RepID=A0A4R9LT10_9LEPT|nr:Fic family protein [Leptospira ilyithenensis]TGN10564.1 Fic family protein [Leptospira ilyithenensis]